jgi:hypothetical protein
MIEDFDYFYHKSCFRASSILNALSMYVSSDRYFSSPSAAPHSDLRVAAWSIYVYTG